MTTQTTARYSGSVNQLHQGPVDFDLLQAAYKAAPQCAIARYHWLKSPLSPFKPIGHIPFEWVLQLATFLIPICVLLLAWAQWAETYFWGVPTFVLWALPVALRIGWVLDNRYNRWLSMAVTQAQAEDGGRYQAVNFISRRTGIQPADLTLEVVEKMAVRYVEECQRQDPLKRQAAQATAAAASARKSYSAEATTVGLAAAGAAIATYANDGSRMAEQDDMDVSTVEPFDSGIDMLDDSWSTPTVESQVNVNGTPMVSGSGVDIYGSPYGVDNV